MHKLFEPTAEERQAPAVVEDDRTTEQLATHRQLIGGRDRFMSGWGMAPNGSYAYWACRFEDAETVAKWVESRDEIKLGVYRDAAPRRGRGTHSHVYVVGPDHPALKGGN